MNNKETFDAGAFLSSSDLAHLANTALKNIELEREVRFKKQISIELELEQKKANKKRWFRKAYVPKTKEQLIEHYKTSVYDKDCSFKLPYTLYMKYAGNYYVSIELKFKQLLTMCQTFPNNKEIFISTEFLSTLMDWQKKPIDVK